MEIDEFISLLQNLKDGSQVTQYQIVYQKALETQLSNIVSLEMQIILESDDEAQILQSVVLLRRIFLSDSFFDIDPDTHSAIQQNLINFFQIDDLEEHTLDLVAELAGVAEAMYITQDENLTFLLQILDVARAGHPTLSAAAVKCINEIVNRTAQHLEEFVQPALDIIITGIDNEISGFFITEALALLYNIILRHPPAAPFGEYYSIITPALTAIAETNYIIEAMRDLYPLIRERAISFGENLPSLLDFLYSIVSSELNTGTKTIAMECIMCIAKQSQKAFQPHLEDAINCFLQAATDAPEDYLWGEYVDTAVMETADLGIYVLCDCFVKWRGFPEELMSIIAEYVNSEEWEARRAGIAALDKLIETGRDLLSESMDEISEILIEHFGDPSPQVRYESYYAFGHASITYAPAFGIKLHADVMDPLINAIKNETTAQTKDGAIRALSRFCEKLPTELLCEHGESLMANLVEVVQEEGAEQQIALMKSLAFLARSMQQSFSEFYEFFRDWLFRIFDEYDTSNYAPILARAIETFPIIGEAVEDEEFMPDAALFLDKYLAEDLTEMCDAQFDALHEAIRTLVTDQSEFFNDYVERAVSVLVSFTENPLEVSITDESYTGSKQNITVQRSDGRFDCYSRSNLQAIQQCVKTISKIVLYCPGASAQFLGEISEACYNLCHYSVFPDLQKEAIDCLGYMLEATGEKAPEVFAQYASDLQASVFKLLERSYGAEITTTLMLLLSKTIDAGADVGNVVPTLGAMITEFVQESIARRTNYIQAANGENTASFLREDELVLAMGKAVEASIKAFPGEAMSFLEQEGIQSERLLNLIVRTDLVRFVDNSELDELIRIIRENISDTRMNVIRVAYLCFADLIASETITDPGLLNEVGAEAVSCIAHFDNNEDMAAMLAIDGCVVALTSIMTALGGPTEQYIGALLPQLPLEQVTVEAEAVYSFIAEAVINGDPVVVTEQNLGKLLEVLAFVIRHDLVSYALTEQAQEAIAALSKIEALSDAFEAGFSSLDPNNKYVVQLVLDDE